MQVAPKEILSHYEICSYRFDFLSGAAQAESLCGVTDEAAVFAALQGDWNVSGSVSLETETLSVTRPNEGTAAFREDFVVVEIIEDGTGTTGNLATVGQVYDVDQVDDILETVEAEWIADDLSLTPCGPEGLLQLSSQVEEFGNLSRLTVLPYFDDQILVISESERKGDWGLAFVTFAGLLTRPES